MKGLKKIKKHFVNQAFDHKKSKGRCYAGRNPKNKEIKILQDEDIFDSFMVDEVAIRNSKSYRRLGGKTQVFTAPDNPLIRNRLTHSIEVCSTAEIIATILGLNVSLVRAIATGHDIGHAPFGHLGERILSQIFNDDFRHEKFGVILAQKIERQGDGLNLTFETLEGIHEHSRGEKSLIINHNKPLEYSVVMMADKITYTLSDVSDAIRLGKLNHMGLPEEINILGKTQREQLNICIKSLCLESFNAGYISFELSREARAFQNLRNWMYQNLYLILDKEDVRKKMEEQLFKTHKFVDKYLCPDGISPVYVVATMTDEEVFQIYEIQKNPTIKDFEKIYKMGFFETIPYCLNNPMAYKKIF